MQYVEPYFGHRNLLTESTMFVLPIAKCIDQKECRQISSLKEEDP